MTTADASLFVVIIVLIEVLLENPLLVGLPKVRVKHK